MLKVQKVKVFALQTLARFSYVKTITGMFSLYYFSFGAN